MDEHVKISNSVEKEVVLSIAQQRRRILEHPGQHKAYSHFPDRIFRHILHLSHEEGADFARWCAKISVAFRHHPERQLAFGIMTTLARAIHRQQDRSQTDRELENLWQLYSYLRLKEGAGRLTWLHACEFLSGQKTITPAAAALWLKRSMDLYQQETGMPQLRAIPLVQNVFERLNRSGDEAAANDLNRWIKLYENEPSVYAKKAQAR